MERKKRAQTNALINHFFRHMLMTREAKNVQSINSNFIKQTKLIVPIFKYIEHLFLTILLIQQSLQKTLLLFN